jgi:heme-degrading monooxygenase HmoA
MAGFAKDQIVTVFRSRLDPLHEHEYGRLAPEITALASTMPGFVDAKTFQADDGERVTLVTFADEDSHRAWRDHPEHRRAQGLGRARFYLCYTLQVCRTLSVREHARR